MTHVLDCPTTVADNENRTIDRGVAMTDTAHARPAPNGQPTYRRPDDTPRVSAAKARLRVALDEQLGRKTPQSVKEAAAGKQ